MTKQEQLTAIAKWFNDGGVWKDIDGLDLAYWSELVSKYSVCVGFANSDYYPYERCDGCYTFTREEVEAEQERLKVGEVGLKVGEWLESPSGANMFYVGLNSDEDHVFELENGDLTVFYSLKGFKPAKSDCEQWVEHAKCLLGFEEEDEQFLRQLYNAGLAKMPES